MEYWASARLLLTGQNPYSPEQMLSLQQTIEPHKRQPLLSWIPPWTLAFTAPFGLMSFPTAHFIWILMSVACLIFCPPYLWKIYGGDPSKARIAWLLCFATVPTFMVLYLKQITVLLLVGMVAFLYFQGRGKLFASGLCLTLLAIKPHLAYLFWIALLFWTFHTRQWRVICGGALGVALASALPVLIRPDIFTLYFQQYSTTLAPKPLSWQTPTLSTAFAHLVGTNTLGLRSITAVAGSIWLVYYWFNHRTRWNWVEELPLLLLVSQLTTPFAWTFDQVLLLPALMEVAVLTSKESWAAILKALAIGFTLINLGPLVILFIDPNYFWLFWMVPLYLLAYLRFKQKPATVRMLAENTPMEES